MSLKQPRFPLKGRRIHSYLLSPETLQRPLVRRGDHFVAPLFSGGLSPVETDMGESSVSGRRIGLNHDLRTGTLPLGRSVE
jgi:hypothetical protein